VKLPVHRAGLPGNEISFFIVPLDPAYKAGLAGHLPVDNLMGYISHYHSLMDPDSLWLRSGGVMAVVTKTITIMAA
jgi:hypothetical protein